MTLRTAFYVTLLAPVCATAYDLHTRELTPVKENPRPAGEPIRLVADGGLTFVIATDLQAEARTENCRAQKSIAPAVELLQDAFRLTTGRTPEVVDAATAEKTERKSAVIYVGDSAPARRRGVEAMKLPDDGFTVRTCPHGIIIAGNDSSLCPGFNAGALDRRGSSRGTFNGVLDFIERFLGVRYYFPGEYGTYAPRIADLTIEPVCYSDAPWYRTRGARYYYVRDLVNARGLARWRKSLGEVTVRDAQTLLDRWRVGSTAYGGGHHSPEPHAYLKSHPDKVRTIFYTSPHGKFWYNPAAHIGNYYNVLDLRFADLLADDFIAYVRSDGKIKNPGFGSIGGRKSLSFGICDTYMPIGEVLNDPTVRRLGLVTDADIARGKDAGMANIYGRFYQYLGNRLKREIPDAKLWLLIYYNSLHASLDPRWKLPDNIEINFCAGALPLYTRNAEKMKTTRKTLQEWYDALGGRPAQKVWLYNSRLNTFARAVAPEFIGEIPKIFGKLIGRDGGLFYDWDGSNDIWNFYYAAYAGIKSQWNPDFDVDAAIDTHWEKFYGPAAGAHLRQFHRVLKKAYLNHFVNAATASPLYPPAVIDEMEKRLAAAEAVLRPGSPEMKRFRLLAEPWPAAFAKQRALAAYHTPLYHVVRKGVRTRPIDLLDPAGSGTQPKSRADIRLWWDEKGLYGILRADAAPAADPKANLWANDTLELFFSPGLEKKTKYLVAFDATGRKHTEMQRLLPIPQPVDLTWKCEGARIKPEIRADGWSARFFIPFQAFETGAPAAYDTWHFNIVRTRRAGGTEVSGNSLTMGNHHNLPMFGAVKFAGKGDAFPAERGKDVRAEIGNGPARYPFRFSISTPKETRPGRFTLKPAEFRDETRSGISPLIDWFMLTVNGIPMEKLVFDTSALVVSPDRRELSFPLNFDGAVMDIRFRLVDGSPVLRGEILAQDPSKVKRAELRLRTIPSRLEMQNKVQARFTGYRRTLEKGPGWYLFGDSDFDGSAADGSKGYGPTVFFVDEASARAVRPIVDGSWTSQLLIELDPAKTLKFGVYENHGAPKSSAETSRLAEKTHL